MRLIHRILRVLVPAIACAAADPLTAQLLPLSLEARGGAALPAGEFRDAVQGGPAGEVSATWHALPLAGVYGAYQWNRFSWDGMEGHATDAGFAVGIRIAIPTPLLPIDPWIRAGVVAHRLDAETLDEEAKRMGGGRRAGVSAGARAHPYARRAVDALPARERIRGRRAAARAPRARGRGAAAALLIRVVSSRSTPSSGFPGER